MMSAHIHVLNLAFSEASIRKVAASLALSWDMDLCLVVKLIETAPIAAKNLPM